MTNMAVRRFLERGILFSKAGLALLNLLVLTSVGVAAYQSLNGLLKTIQEEEQALKRSAELQNILTLMTDAETGRRGYVLTGQERFLEPYDAATVKLDPTLQQVQDLLVDDPAQQQAFAMLKGLIQRRSVSLRQSIALYRENQDIAAQTALSDRGKVIHDQIRAAIATMQAYERQRLQNVEAQSQTQTQLTLLILGLGIPFSLVIFAITYFLLHRQILARQLTEVELQRVNRALRTLSDCNQILVRATHEEDLLHNICQTIVSVGSYRLVWVGFVEQNHDKTVRPVATAGCDRRYLDKIRLTWAESYQGNCPAGTAIRTKQPCVVQDIPTYPSNASWQTEAVQHGFAALISLPLIIENQAIGVLNLYADEPNAFTDEEIKLLEELAGDAAYGIAAIRIRRAHHQTEAALARSVDQLQSLNLELEARVINRTAELNQANQQLTIEIAERRESERRWLNLLENVHLLVVGLDCAGKVTYVNPFFLALSGYTYDEIIGQDWYDRCVPDYQQQQVRNDLHHERLSQGINTYYQNLVVTKRGEERIVAWNNTLLHDPQGEVIGLIGIGEDITERQVIDRMKDEFVSVVSHELRTPLTSIYGALNLLSEKLVAPDSEQGQRVIQIAAENADRLVKLVNDILDLERLESGKISLKKQPCNVSALLARSIDLMQLTANRAGIGLEVSSVNAELNIDSDRILQVLTNLLSNAIKFSAAGSTVWLRAELQTVDCRLQIDPFINQSEISNLQSTIPASYLLFSIKDQGRGIPANKLESIFERFQQVDASDSRRKGGTGLGLAICRSIVQQHGGKIWAESVIGEGSSFYFTLPL